MKKLLIVLATLVLFYLGAMAILYFAQEKFLFHPYRLNESYQFQFQHDFEEVVLQSEDGKKLHHLHFKNAAPKGVVLFLHGNGGTLRRWGMGHRLFTDIGYDVLYSDYRGYGKSQGKIDSEEQMIADAQLAYDYLKQSYPEDQIVLSGTSMGTGVATQLAATNNPARLLLTSPYASLKRLVGEKLPFFPISLLRYPMNSEQHILKVKCPVDIFHGDKDLLIPYHHAEKLQEVYPSANLHKLVGCGHRVRVHRKDYRSAVRNSLEKVAALN